MKLTHLCITAALLLSSSLVSADMQQPQQQHTAAVASVALVTPDEAANINPAVKLKLGLDALLLFLRSEPSLLELGTYLEETIAPAFDFEFMSRASAGPLYRYMDDSQKARLAKKMEVMFLTSLAEKLAMYDNQDVAYLPPRRNRRGQVMVSALVNNPGRYPGRIDFRMHQTDHGWKVYDVVGNGASAVAYYRNYFRKAMR